MHVKPRSEKALARRCFSRQASFFLPQCRQQRREGAGRSKDAFLPLFPGYLFLFGDERNRIIALETNLVVNVLPVANQVQLFEDLKRINTVLEAGLAMTPEQRLQPGSEVTIVAGPLSGMQGTVIRHKNKISLILKVAFLQQGASVELENWMVEPLLEATKV
jgi:transcriptional antiterminator RfaH